MLTDARTLAEGATIEAGVCIAGATRTIERASSQEKAIGVLVRDVQRDFREERSVQVEGWILSRTEVELCILTLLP